MLKLDFDKKTSEQTRKTQNQNTEEHLATRLQTYGTGAWEHEGLFCPENLQALQNYQYSLHDFTLRSNEAD